MNKKGGKAVDTIMSLLLILLLGIALIALIKNTVFASEKSQELAISCGGAAAQGAVCLIACDDDIHELVPIACSLGDGTLGECCRTRDGYSDTSIGAFDTLLAQLDSCAQGAASACNLAKTTLVNGVMDSGVRVHFIKQGSSTNVQYVSTVNKQKLLNFELCRDNSPSGRVELKWEDGATVIDERIDNRFSHFETSGNMICIK